MPEESTMHQERYPIFTLSYNNRLVVGILTFEIGGVAFRFMKDNSMHSYYFRRNDITICGSLLEPQPRVLPVFGICYTFESPTLRKYKEQLEKII
jgi:hypothetical protein